MKTSCIEGNVRKWLKNEIKLTKQKIYLIMRHVGQEHGKTGSDIKTYVLMSDRSNFHKKENHICTLIQDYWTTAG